MSSVDAEGKDEGADATPKSFPSLAHEAVHLTMTNRFNAARDFINAHQADDVRVEEIGALTDYIMAVSCHADALLDQALKSTWSTEAHARKQLSSSKKLADRIEGELIQADTHMLGALTQLVQQAYLKMAWNVRKSYGFYLSAEKHIQEEEDRAEGGKGSVEALKLSELKGWMQFGIGLFNMVLSLLPASVMTVAEWIGYHGDREKAFQYLRASQQSPSFMAPFACLLLCTYYLTVSQFIGQDDPAFHAEAKKLLEWANVQYPNGAFFLLQESRYYRVKAEPKKAIEIAQVGLKRITEMPSVAVMFQYQCGWCGLFSLEWEQCGRYFDAMLHSKFGGDYVEPADSPRSRSTLAPDDSHETDIPPTKASAQSLYAYLCGIAYANAGDTHRAEWYLRSVPSWLTPQQKPIDLFAVRRASQVLRRQPAWRQEELTLDVMELIICWNGLPQLPASSIDALRTQLAAVQPLTAASHPHPLAREDVIRFEWALAELDGISNPQAARERVERALEQHEAWLKGADAETKRAGQLAFLYYALADNCVALKEWAAAKHWLNKAKEQKNFDLYNPLQLKVHATGQRIKREENDTPSKTPQVHAA